MISLERASIGMVIGLMLLSVSWFPPKAKSWVREWAFPIAGLLGGLILVVSAGILCGIAGISIVHLFLPQPDPFTVKVVAAVGMLSGFWGVSIGTQLIQNCVRAIQGLPARKIKWIKRPSHKIRRKHKS
ncbi:MAG TPA: hypothetical protein VJS47_00890 [Rhizomicrobium sp.]|nr:hypothetical protein [Rhizomicrobium sp.]